MPARIPMTERQRAALLALPGTEAMVVRHHGLDAEDLSAIGIARTPATRLSYALQLCCLRYPGRHLPTRLGLTRASSPTSRGVRRPATISLPPSKPGLVFPI